MTVNQYRSVALEPGPPIQRPDLARRAGAEALAAFALVFAGCGAAVANVQYDQALGTVGVALVFGLIIMVMVYAIGHLSGAHINPAVTIAFTLSRHFPAREAAAYVAAQVWELLSPRCCCWRSGPTSRLNWAPRSPPSVPAARSSTSSCSPRS